MSFTDLLLVLILLCREDFVPPAAEEPEPVSLVQDVVEPSHTETQESAPPVVEGELFYR